jgi:hypothetical protein
MDKGTRTDLTLVEILAYGVMLAVVATGFYIATVDEAYFRNTFIPEDGLLETGTAAMIFAAGVIVLLRYFRERGTHPRAFAISSFVLVFVFFFVAGEEISWGQRIFGIEPGEFFIENNRQNETNLHNLEVYGVNLNKLIFSKGLVTFLVIFYLIVPHFFKKRGKLHDRLSKLYFPIPKPHHGFFMLFIGIVIDQIPSPKRGELNEVCLGIFALLLVLYAQNIKARKE